MSLRGILRGFGLKVDKTTATSFAARIRELVDGHPTLQGLVDALLSIREVLLREFKGFEKRVRTMARHNEQAKLLMSTTGVGAIISLTYAAAIDDPARFESSKVVGAHYGMTPKKYQSGQTDYNGRISKIGDASVRRALWQAAHVILTRSVKDSALKTWGLSVAKRKGMAKAKVALARKLAVVMHRMLVDGKSFDPALPKQAAAARMRSPRPPSVAACSSPSRPLRAAFGGGLRPALHCDCARCLRQWAGRDGETHSGRTKKLAVVLNFHTS